MFLHGSFIVPLHSDVERSKVKVKNAKCRAITPPHMIRFTSSADDNVPIPRRVCLLCLALQIFSSVALTIQAILLKPGTHWQQSEFNTVDFVEPAKTRQQS